MNCWVYFVLYFLSHWQLKTCSKVCKLVSGRREVVTCLSLLMSYTKHTLPIWHSNYAAESPIFPCQCWRCPAFLLYVLTPTPPQCHAPIFICNIFGERLDWNYFAALKKKLQFGFGDWNQSCKTKKNSNSDKLLTFILKLFPIIKPGKEHLNTLLPN